jgi:hypothetical protein
MKSWALWALIVSTIFVPAAGAVVITFSNLAGPNFDPMPNPYVESTYSVTTASGDWFQGQNFGAPVPSIFSNSISAAIEVRQNTLGLFRFASVDLADASNGGPGYTLEGFLLGAPVFSTSGGPLPSGFSTIPSPNPAAAIDLLRITMVRNNTSSYNIDNINVTVVPEPSSVVLLAFALPGLCLRCRATPS